MDLHHAQGLVGLIQNREDRPLDHALLQPEFARPSQGSARRGRFRCDEIRSLPPTSRIHEKLDQNVSSDLRV
jgi:hypothetical protein